MTTLNDQQAEKLRAEAERYDLMAFTAENEGDKWDAAQLRAKAMQLRRQARDIIYDFDRKNANLPEMKP